MVLASLYAQETTTAQLQSHSCFPGCLLILTEDRYMYFPEVWERGFVASVVVKFYNRLQNCARFLAIILTVFKRASQATRFHSALQESCSMPPEWQSVWLNSRLTRGWKLKVLLLRGTCNAHDSLSLPKLLNQLQELKTLEKKDVVKYLYALQIDYELWLLQKPCHWSCFKINRSIQEILKKQQTIPLDPLLK